MAGLEDKVTQTQTALQTTYKEIKDKTELGINNLQVKQYYGLVGVCKKTSIKSSLHSYSFKSFYILKFDE